MKTFKVAVSGWAVVEVKANTAEQAENKVADEHPGIAGDLYDLEVHEAVAEDQPFEMHTDLN